MDQVPPAQLDCDHKFKQMSDGMLRCELCGEQRVPAPHVEPSLPRSEPHPGKHTESVRKGRSLESAISKVDWLFDWWPW